MRGRTLNESFIILDEAQNTTVEQMKMFLTRIGCGSTAVVNGDVTQVDLPRGKQSGLRHIVNVLKDVDGISFNFFKSKDVVRHPLVARILDAYEIHENEIAEKSGRVRGKRRPSAITHTVSAHIDVQFACRSAAKITSAVEVETWAVAALGGCDGEQNLTVRFVDESEAAALNQRYRQRPGPANVLSFPYDSPPGSGASVWGDIAVCAPVALREAGEQGKTVQAHCAHLGRARRAAFARP